MIDIGVECKEGDVCQIGMVVNDLDATVKRYVEELGLGPWYIWNFEPPVLRDVYYKGIKVERSGFKLALAKIGPLQYEFVEPMYGVGIHREHLDEKGEGFHHMKLYYPDVPKALEKFAKMGIYPLQQGRYEDDWYVYMDTADKYGIIYEIGNCGAIGAPLRQYPEK